MKRLKHKTFCLIGEGYRHIFLEQHNLNVASCSTPWGHDTNFLVKDIH